MDGETFYFDVSGLEHKRANEKRELIYAFEKRDQDGRLIFTVAYSERSRKTKIDDILRSIGEAGVDLAEETLTRAFRVFEKQSEVDYFINKNARAFLQEQFDLWLYQYIFKGESSFSETRLHQLQALKDIAYKIIDFIAQFEDELVRIWNKPKFVRNSHYILTLDKFLTPLSTSKASGEEPGVGLLDRLFAHPAMPDQIAEWDSLGMLPAQIPHDPAGLLDILNQADLVGAPLYPQYRYLPLDTRYFPDLELEILELFDDLDAALDGWLVHSENYQALNTLLPKFQEQVKAIYIDPPYNTGTESSDFIYDNQFRNSSWLTLVENRLRIAINWLDINGILCCTIDDYEFKYLSTLLESFPRARNLGVVAINSKPQGRATARGFSVNHEYAIFIAISDIAEVGRLQRTGSKADRYSKEDGTGIYAWTNFRGTGAHSTRHDRPKLFYPIYINGDQIHIPSMFWNRIQNTWEPQVYPLPGEELIWPIDDNGQERVWTFGWERAQRELHDLVVVRGDKSTQIQRKYRPNYEGALPGTWWDDTHYSASESGTKVLQNILGDKSFSYPKSIYAVMDSLRACGLGVEQSGIVLDFFAGSGTTAHAVMNLNRLDGGRRKYILVEMGEHFNTVILPRIKKVAFSDKWKDGKTDGGQGMSHLVKYFNLEQYEDTLRRACYEDAPLFAGTQDAYTSYVFLRDLKLLEAVQVDPDQNKVSVRLDQLYKGIDLAETLSCLTGKWIKRVTHEAVEFQDGTSASLSDPDWELVKPLVWW